MRFYTNAQINFGSKPSVRLTITKPKITLYVQLAIKLKMEKYLKNAFGD